ncbi:hypothetical protein P3T21_007291 [Paraburkholderia sp. GAS334]
MAKQNAQTSNDQAEIVKGKSPRNALISAGIVAGLVIGALGFYYQVKASHQADEEVQLQKKAKTAEVVDKTNSTEDVEKIIHDQQSAARRAAASEARVASAPIAADATTRTKPGLTVDNFLVDQGRNGTELKEKFKQDDIYTSPIFRPGVKIRASGRADDSVQCSLANTPNPSTVHIPGSTPLRNATFERFWAMGERLIS